MENDNIRLLERFYDVWHAGDVPAALEFIDPGFEFVNPEYAVDPGIRRGHEGFTQVMANLDSSFAYHSHAMGEVIDLGDRVLWHTVFQARGHSGAQLEIPEQHLWTLRDGKVLRLQWFHDADEARRAAGLGPADQ